MGNADIALRHLTRRHPEELARVFVPPGAPVEVLGWIDTQVTCLERRLDKALRLRVAGEPRVLQIEFFIALRADVPFRIFEYLGFLVGALRAEAKGAQPPQVESVAIILSGRRRRWPSHGAFRTGWPGSRFSGARFRIDAVYQRTVAELRARGSLLWLVFTPLARDASAALMREVVAEIRASTAGDEERAELYTAMLVLASVDPWGQNLRREIAMLVEDEDREMIMLVPMLREAFLKGEKQGEEGAIRQLLGGLFARRVGRRPTSAEETSLVQRTQVLGADHVEGALLDLERDALVRWLAQPCRGDASPAPASPARAATARKRSPKR
jgi:hypothetical protein